MSDTAPLKAILVLPLLLFFSGAGAQAQPAFRVVDLNTTRSEGIQPEDSVVTDKDFAARGETVFFAASDGIHGLEPWQTDGTEAGTRPVADLCPGVCPSTPQEFTTVGGLVFFAADDGAHKRQLWRSDGTPAGTVLVKNLFPINDSGWFAKANLRELNGLILFSAPGGLWRSDGTAAGTFLLKASFFLPLARLGEKLFFIATDQDHGIEVWTTDGTVAGTVLLKDISPGPSDGAAWFYDKSAAAAGKVFFVASGGLWASDGTEAGTVLAKSGAFPYSLTALGGKVYFFGQIWPTDDEFKLWQSDGTLGGTQPVRLVPYFDDHHVTMAGGRLFFFVDCDLWTSDGSEAGTLLVKSGVACHPSPVIGGGEKLLFAGDDIHGVEPWQSDGTPAGTSLIADLYPGSSSSLSFSDSWTRRGTFNDGRWYFLAKSTEDIGTQLWTTDGTAAGTRMLRINPQQSGLAVNSRGELWGPRAFFDLDGTLLFQGGDSATGIELWKTDGTAAGTSLLKDVQPGPSSSVPGELTRVGSTVFFRSYTNSDLWKTNGTPEGTQRLFTPDPLPSGTPVYYPAKDLTPFGNDLLFLGWNNYSLWDLMKSDGTPEGTGPVGDAWSVVSMVSLGDRILFQTGKYMEELWESDATGAGSERLASVLLGRPLLADSSVTRNGVLFFPGITFETGEELWQSDGTVAGTHLVAETVPGPGSKPLGPFATAGPIVFFVAGGNELWKNDAGSTSLVRALPGDPSPDILSLTAFQGKVYFSYDDGMNGRELWVSDGTEAGTHVFKDIVPGPGSSYPGHFHVEGNVLLFSATDGIHSLEPWRSDGTVLGTRMLQDVAPGDLPSSPIEFTASGPYVYFGANDGTTGFELWALPRQSLLATFADVPTDYWAWRFVEALVASGITGGCGPGEFCPTRRVTRAEAAIFLVRAAHGPAFNPPPATGAVFQDIPAGHWAGRWIEQLAADGVTSGCGGGNFCPDSPLTRAELAVFLLRARHGSGYVPAPATGTVFNDIPADYWAASWIERLAAEGAAAGCGGGNYCPETTISRAETAVFLGTVFGLPLP